MYVCIGCKKEETEEIVKKMGLAGNGEDTFACKVKLAEAFPLATDFVPTPHLFRR